MIVYVLALLIGLVAGLRTMTAITAVSWAAALGALHLDPTWLAFLGYRWTPYVLTVLALGEFVTDQLPSTPSRTVPLQFGARLVIGAVSGGVVGTAAGSFAVGAGLGIVGALIGTLGGSAARGRLATAFGKDLPAAVLEDIVAIGAAALIVAAIP